MDRDWETLRQITAQTQNIKAQTNLADMNAAAVGARIPGLEADSKVAAETVLDRIGQAKAQKDLLSANARKAFVDAGIASETRQAQIQRIINDSKISQLNVRGKELQNAIDAVKADLAKDGLSLSDNMWIRIVDSIVPGIRERLLGGRLFKQN